MSKEITVLTQPKTPWSLTVDAIEKEFAPRYDEEEYGKNPALAMMCNEELYLLRQSMGIVRDDLVTQQETLLLGRTFIVVGTGTGREVLELAAHGSTVIGFDATREYVEITQEKVIGLEKELGRPLNTQLYVSLAENFPYPTKVFDGASSLFGVLNHVENWQETINKISNSLKPKGKLVISMYGPNDALVFRLLKQSNLAYRPSILQRRTIGGILLGDSTDVLPANFPDPNEVTQELRINGFWNIRSRGLLRIAALYPQNPTPENISAFKHLTSTIDPRAGKLLSILTDPEKLLRTSFLFDQQNQDELNDFAYVAFIAEKK